LQIEERNYFQAAREFERIMEENPENTDTRKGLIYTEILKSRR